jgi:AcrR family transcriptional regulator
VSGASRGRTDLEPTERSDALRNRRAILAAASNLFAVASDPLLITMDDIAAAAKVGKGTVFRRFGDRAGMLRAVLDDRIATLMDRIEHGSGPLGPSTPPRERIIAVLLAVIDFKVANRGLFRALEQNERPVAGGFQKSANYRWAHALMDGMLAEIVAPNEAGFCAHALLSLTRIDLIDHMMAQDGYALADLKRHVRIYLHRLIESHR